MIKIMLACSAGMSTSLLVTKMQKAAKEKGMKVIALSSREFGSVVTSRHSSGKNLQQIADVLIDIKCVAGDACLSIDEMEEKFCGTSTVLGMAVMEGVIARTIEICVENGYIPPVYVSSNLDKGDAINAKYIQEYRTMIDCL